MWVYFPEADIPTWGPTDPGVFSGNVTRSVQIQKGVFPGSQASILLDAMSYPAGSSGWDNGAYVSLAPYVNNIPKGLLDSFGLQGFPWTPPANGAGSANLNPSTFLNYKLAAEAAKILGTSNIWLNSGTFRASYTNKASQTVSMSSLQRQSILNGIAAQATTLHSSGYLVAVNLFSQDKSNTGEAIDWSYFKTGAANQSPDTAILKNFIGQLHAAGIDFWLFDTF
jgi:hypothetical protein